MVLCDKCGLEAPVGRKFCASCGSALPGESAVPKQSSPIRDAPRVSKTPAVTPPATNRAESARGPARVPQRDAQPRTSTRLPWVIAAFVVGGLVVGLGVWALTRTQVESVSAAPAATVTTTASAQVSPTESANSGPSPSAPSATENVLPTPSSELSASPEAAGSNAPQVLPGIQDVEFSPDYVLITDFQTLEGGAAILVYDRLSPDGDRAAGSGCRVLAWSFGDRCVSNVTARLRTVGVVPGAFVVTPTGGLEPVDARSLGALRTSPGTSLRRAQVVALVVDGAGLVREIRMARR